MLTTIQRLTAAEALANLDPYDNENRNATSYIFLDIEDNDTLKGIFFDDTQPNDKVVRVLGARITGEATRYTALLTQVGANAPVATVLENTMSAPIVWSRLGAGFYLGSLVGAFPLNKTIPKPMVMSVNGVLNFVQRELVYFTTDAITIVVNELIGANIGTPVTPTAADGMMTNTLVEIRTLD